MFDHSALKTLDTGALEILATSLHQALDQVKHAAEMSRLAQGERTRLDAIRQTWIAATARHRARRATRNQAIRKSFEAGQDPKAIAGAHNIHPATVRKIVRAAGLVLRWPPHET